MSMLTQYGNRERTVGKTFKSIVFIFVSVAIGQLSNTLFQKKYFLRKPMEIKINELLHMLFVLWQLFL